MVEYGSRQVCSSLRRAVTMGMVVATAVLGVGTPVATANYLTYADAVLADGPLVYWRLGEAPGSTVAVDTTGNGRNGTYSNTLLGVAGALRADGDTAARFVQYSGVMGAPDVPAGEGVAVELWVRTTVSGVQVVTGGGGATDGWSVSVGTDGRVSGEVHQWNVYRRTTTGPSTVVNDGAWHHVVANLNGDSSQIYVDSVAGTSAPVYESAVICPRWAPCAYPDDPPILAAGRAEADLDELAVYAGSLSATKVALHYQLGIEEPQQPGPGEPPVDTEDDPIEIADPDPVDSDNPDSPNEGGITGSAGVLTTPAVTYRTGRDMVKFRNADGVWTIYRRCHDRLVGGFRYTVGPGYIARLIRNNVRLVDDFHARTDTWSPGYINAVNGGLGAFGLHYARGVPGQTQAGDDVTTSGEERGTGREVPAIEGRMCPSKNLGAGVYNVAMSPPSRISSTHVTFSMDVWLRDQWGGTGFGPGGNGLLRIRYRYSFYRSSVKVWMGVVTYAKPNTAGTPFVKEPKFAAVTRPFGTFSRISVFVGPNGTDFLKGITFGEPPGDPVLRTDHTAEPARRRVRWDNGTSPTSEQPSTACSSSNVCLNAVMQAYDAPGGNVVRHGPTYPWEGSARGLDLWAVRTVCNPGDCRLKSYARDTRGDLVVTSCEVPPVDLNGDGQISEVERAIASEGAAPSDDGVRRWEHGGFKSGGLYQDSFTFFNGWEGGRGPYDCEPLQRAFGPQGQGYGVFASYSVNDGWALG